MVLLRSDDRFILDRLVSDGLLSDAEMDKISSMLQRSRMSLEETVVAESSLSAEDLAHTYSRYFKSPYVEIDAVQELIRQFLGECIPEKFAREKSFVPLEEVDGGVVIAFANPSRVDLIQEIQFLLGRWVRPVVASRPAIQGALDSVFGERDVIREMVEEINPEDDAGGGRGESASDTLDLDSQVDASKESHIIEMVNQVLRRAIMDRASDIHLEPTPEDLRVRIRIDGVLNEISPIPRAMMIPFISRLKVLAQMDIAEKRIPQDGAITVSLKNSSIDFRLSTIPSVFGEKMVIRILNKESVPLDLTRMGMAPSQEESYTRAATASNGLLLVTGPTGSGKTTTLYATLNFLRDPTKNICTAEDPVEYRFSGINQVQVKKQVGLSFPELLRAFLRQDPDIIMVGEIRDGETAEICTRAALTGHFVLSTLHTNNALDAVTRLMDIGIAPFLLGSTLRLVQAQRLVRALCTSCFEPYHLDPEILERHGFSADDVIYRPHGCEVCRFQGYRGRIGLFEMVPVTAAISEMIIRESSVPEMRRQVIQEGNLTLEQHGVMKVRQGVTSLEELHRVVIGGQD